VTRWDDLPQVLSPVGRPIADVLEEGPPRQDLPGFDPVYRDFVDYIMRCTHRIWEEKNIGLCRTHYGDDCTMHTLAGPAVGAETVVQGTIGALAMSSDRQVIGEDVIWSADDDGRLYSSHRITSQMTHMGDDAMLGAATMRPINVTTIADCACRENRIVEEWLVRDNWRAVAQIGGDPWAVAQMQAAADREGDPARHDWRKVAMKVVHEQADCVIPGGHPAQLPATLLRAALRNDFYGDAAEALSVAAEVRWPSNRHGFGRGYWIGCVTQLRAMLHDPAFRLEHIAARPLPGDDIAVSIRWSMTGAHHGAGLWGPATGRDILIMAVSHYRLRGGLIVEDVTVFDELAVLRQIAGGLGA
jgi:SnoaL-like polyketide cyclase